MTIIPLLLTALLPLFPHGDDHEVIEELSRRLLADPDNAALLMRRGELHRRHGALDAARTDFARLRAADPDHPAAGPLLARLDLLEGAYAQAVEALTTHLRRHPYDAAAWALRAEAHQKLHQRTEATVAFQRALTADSTERPDLRLQYIRHLSEPGSTEDLQAAVQALDPMLKKSAPPVALVMEAISLRRRLRDFDGALAQLRSAASRSRRKVGWHLAELELLIEAERWAEARACASKLGPELERDQRAPEEWHRRFSVASERLGGSP